MANISQVKMPDNSNYHFKDTEATEIFNNLNALNLSYNNTGMPIEDENVQDALDTISLNLQPNLLIQIDSGSSITITNGTTSITGTSIGGQFSTKIPKLGTWIITATLNGRTAQKTISILSLGKTYTVLLEYFSATLTVTTVAGATVYISGADELEEIATGGTATFNLSLSGNYNAIAKFNNVYSESISFSANADGESISKTLNFIILNLTAPEDSEVEITDGDTVIETTGTGSSEIFYLPNTGVWTATAELGGEEASGEINVSGYSSYSLSLSFVHIYGVEWAGTSSPQCTRTDEAALFVDPDPYVADGSHPGSSPFDTLMPWAGMVKETIGEDVFVKIPKFWFKVTTNGTKRKIQIADKAVDGFMVSPAHQDRGDGNGERDYVYVSRYHVNSEYKSKTGVTPLASITRATARSGCANRGTGYCQFDMMTLITIWYLYLVEFAHWNSQLKIGYGCGNDSGKQNTGASDSMPYHTGTMQSSRTAYAVGTQYRWIEDLWGNVLDWVDGIYFSSSTIYAIKNPANFSDTTGGTLVGIRPTSGNKIKAWKDSTVTDYEWFVYPSEVYSDGNYATYCCDHVVYDSSGVVLCFGSDYSQYQNFGLFFLNGYYSSSNSYAYIGARLLYLLPNS